jgi:DNA-binding transcriptional LysR family regulator
MEIALLQAFVEVAKHGSFSVAAESLHLTQPAVSKRVAQLEAELEVRLFDRIGRTVSLTSTGTTLLPRAQRLINDARELKRLVDDLAGEVRGRLLMATSHHVGLHRLPGPLKQFTANYPQVELDIRFMDSEVACRGVETGELELAVVTLPPTASKNLSTLPIWRDPLAFMAGVDHPLASQARLTLDELAGHPAVLPGESTYTRQILAGALRERGVELRVSMTTNYLETLRMLVATGLGWSLLPATLLDDDVVALQVDDMQLTRTLGVVTHRERTLSNAARQMIETCRPG